MSIQLSTTVRRAAVAAAGLAIPIAVASPAVGATADGAPDVPGLVVYSSEYDVPETVARVQGALSEAGMVAAIVDHQANAESVGAQLRPTTLVIGGAPKAGTPLLLEGQEVGVDLPQKYLAWEDTGGNVWLGYNSAEYVATQAGIDTDSEALSGLTEGSAGLAAGASGNDAPASEGAPVVEYEDYRVERRSDTSVDESIARYQAAFDKAGLTSPATVDHQAGAESIGADLRPTQVTYVGNPKLGTPLIAAQQTIGIDLPARYLAWQDEDGSVTVAHVDINVLAERHDVSGLEEILAMVEKGTGNFTATAAGSAPQVGMVPDGGVATGGGSTSGLEHEGLLALGALGLVATGVLAVSSRRQRGRRRS